MFWKIAYEERAEPAGDEATQWDGRYVLQRHCDAEGAHLDLRLEQEGYLLGWRIDGVELNGERWAEEKAPHPLHWLERDGDAVRVDEGVYAWQERSDEGGLLLLQGQDGLMLSYRISRVPGLSANAARGILDALSFHGINPSEAGVLICDGVTARQRAIERLCGLGRELDGSAFDEGLAKKTLKSLTLEEIHGQLRAYEIRFDAKYPPQPVSQPEVLPEERDTGRTDTALAIAREA